MSNDYFPGIGLFNYLTSEGIECEEPSPEPAPEPERDPNVIYAEPIGENREIIALKQKIKTLEDKVGALTHENNNLKMRLELENSIEKIYENIPSLQKIEETIQNITHNVRR
jgi:molecular chaperone GrpE (heat shock protein)